MAWFGNVSLGNFPNLAGAVNKLSESVKNIEKNFDSALGLEDKSPPGVDSSIPSNMNVVESVLPFQQEGSELETSDEMQSDKSKTTSSDGGTQTENINLGAPVESHQENDSQVSHQKPEIVPEQVSEEVSPVHLDVLGSANSSLETDSSDATAIDTIHSERPTEDSDEHSQESPISLKDSSRDFDLAPHDICVHSESVEMGSHEKDFEANSKEESIGASISFSDYVDPRFEVEKVKKEMKAMEAALQGAARQAQIHSKYDSQ